MHEEPLSESATARVYRALKVRAIAFEFPPGQRIYLEPIAKQFGVSTMPVRDALNQLAAEKLVTKARRKGFFAMTLSEGVLTSEYELTSNLLTHALRNLEPAGRRKLPWHNPIASILAQLDQQVLCGQRVLCDVNALATYTGELFIHITDLTGNAQMVEAINRANNHLYYIRTAECQHLQSSLVKHELSHFCELLLAAERRALIDAIQTYHDQRIALLPTLLDGLRR